MGASAAFIVGILGNITGVCLFLAPFMTFYAIYKKKATDSFSPTPYLCTLLNCALWLLYGMPFVTKNGFLIMTINGIGGVLAISYLTIFMTYAPRPAKIRTAQIGSTLGLFVMVVVLVVIFAVHQRHNRHTIVGILCVFVTIVMYAAPLSVMRLVIRTKSVEYMPFALSLMVLLNSAAWSAYALLKNDIYIMIPNFFGVALGVLQLVLYGCYRGGKKSGGELELGHKSTGQQEQDVQNAAEQGMESVSLKDSSSADPKGTSLATYSTGPFSTLRT